MIQRTGTPAQAQLALAVIRIVAGVIFMVHLKNGFFVPMGIEFVLILSAAATAIAIGGPGALSLDSAMSGPRERR